MAELGYEYRVNNLNLSHFPYSNIVVVKSLVMVWSGVIWSWTWPCCVCHEENMWLAQDHTASKCRTEPGIHVGLTSRPIIFLNLPHCLPLLFLQEKGLTCNSLVYEKKHWLCRQTVETELKSQILPLGKTNNIYHLFTSNNTDSVLNILLEWSLSQQTGQNLGEETQCLWYVIIPTSQKEGVLVIA